MRTTQGVTLTVLATMAVGGLGVLLGSQLTPETQLGQAAPEWRSTEMEEIRRDLSRIADELAAVSAAVQRQGFGEGAPPGLEASTAPVSAEESRPDEMELEQLRDQVLSRLDMERERLQEEHQRALKAREIDTYGALTQRLRENKESRERAASTEDADVLRSLAEGRD